MTPPGQTPRDYLPTLEAYQSALAEELHAAIRSLPLAAGQRAIDLACGEGTYACWLAQRVAPGGSVVGVDILPSSLATAQRAAAKRCPTAALTFCRGNARRLPFRDETFDLAWCAHSLYSLDDTPAVLREMVRVVRPGGRVVVLENDTLHHVLLPWPAELEIAVRRAEYAAYQAQSANPEKYYLARQLPRLLREAGLRDVAERAWSSHRQAPLDERMRAYLAGYLHDLRARTALYLPPERLAEFDALAESDWASVTILDRLFSGVK